jgi:hypothetical protein
MHFSFSLLRIKTLYILPTLPAHPQEAPNKRHLVYCVRIMSVGCTTIAVKLQLLAGHDSFLYPACESEINNHSTILFSKYNAAEKE